MKTTHRIRIQNQKFVEGFLKRKAAITFSELFVFIVIGIALVLTSCNPLI